MTAEWTPNAGTEQIRTRTRKPHSRQQKSISISETISPRFWLGMLQQRLQTEMCQSKIQKQKKTYAAEPKRQDKLKKHAQRNKCQCNINPDADANLKTNRKT